MAEPLTPAADADRGVAEPLTPAADADRGAAEPLTPAADTDRGAAEPQTPAADAYRGLCASTYDLLVPPDAVGDVEFFRRAIRDDGEPALEIGCGTGRLLLTYRRDGLDVHGLDASADMLAICSDKAHAAEVSVPLHHQSMQHLDLGLRFRTIYAPYFSFQLLTADADVAAALRRFRAHLEPTGRLLVPLFFPFAEDVGQVPSPESRWRLRREGRTADGDRVECWEYASYDVAAQIKRSTLRFDVLGADGAVVDSQQTRFGIRWYTQAQFADHLEQSGFADVAALSGHSTAPAGPDDTSFTFVARPMGG